MSSIHWRISHRFLTHVSVPRSRYPIPNVRCDEQADDRVFSQYYALATGTILFYDYLLTLEDEVRRVSLQGVFRSLVHITPRRRSNTFGLERNHGVRPLPKIDDFFR